MNTDEERIFQYCNDLAVKIEGTFYMYDKEFDSSNCTYILYMIGKMYIEKGMTSLFKKQILEFIDKCLCDISGNYKFDYKILYDNLDKLMIDNLIFEEDVENLKNKISSRLENKKVQESNKILSLSYVV